MKPLPVLAMLRFLLLATTLQGSTTRAEKHMSRVTYAVMLAAFVTSPLTAAHAQDYKKAVIYQVVTDRFYNGSTANDNPPQSSGLYDSTKTNWQAYWGGDLLGIQDKLSYIHGMGATAIWISPTNDNENVAVSPSTSAPYHGYWNRDFMRVEEHFGAPSNSWTAFDNLTSAAHAAGIKVIVDWAQNHSNPNNGGEGGALYNNGTLMATPGSDPNGYFHHNGNIVDYDDRYQVQYANLANLQDLNQENPTIDNYLKTAAELFQAHGADAFRLDAIKSVTWGWEYSFANTIFSHMPSYLFGEWNSNAPTDPLYADAYKFANLSGISELDFGMNQAIRDVFGDAVGLNKPFSEIDSTLSTEDTSFAFPNNLVTFFDSQDESRLFGELTTNQNRLHEALAFLLTCRGIPNIFYGDEQYLYDTSGGGNDPYNRVNMSSFSTTTTAYQLITKLATLRANNEALGYGTIQQRWINNDVYIFERQFYGSIVLVAINKHDTTSYSITGLNTALPASTYSDYLNSLLGGIAITVVPGAGGGNPVAAFTLTPHTVAVWQRQVAATSPEIAGIGPYVGQSGMAVTIVGDGFDGPTGAVYFGTTAATVSSWSNTSVTFEVPSVMPGPYSVSVRTRGGAVSNGIHFSVLTAKLIPVTFTVSNAAPTSPGDYIFFTGNTPELGSWRTTFQTAVGPMLDPNYPNWFMNAAMPAGTNIQFKFIKIAANGAVTWEAGSNHTYTVPSAGAGAVNVTWQY
jgi:glycosidase